MVICLDASTRQVFSTRVGGHRYVWRGVDRAWSLCAICAYADSCADRRGDRNSRAGANADSNACSHRHSASNTFAISNSDAYAHSDSHSYGNVYVDFNANTIVDFNTDGCADSD